MKMNMWMWVALMLALMPTSAAAQALEPEAEQALEQQEAAQAEALAEAEAEQLFRPGTLDLMVGLGLDLGGLFYPHIEPGVDLGLIPIGDDVTLSASVSVDLGYCLLCGVLSLLPQIDSLSSYYIAPTARVLAHLNFLSRLAKLPELDLVAGFLVSPSYYNFKLEYEDTSYDQTALIISLGPVFSGRYILDSGLMVFLEYRYLISAGYTDQEVRASDGSVYNFNTGELGRYGQSYVVGIGYRI